VASDPVVQRAFSRSEPAFRECIPRSDLSPIGALQPPRWNASRKHRAFLSMTIADQICRAAERAAMSKVLWQGVVFVSESLPNGGIWKGEVSLFEFNENQRVYAWADQSAPEPQFIAYVHQPPIDSPIEAVKTSLASGTKR
jgi:hypothetical protein